MIVARTQHTTDEQLDGRECRRTIGNYCNYHTAAGLWLPSDPDLEEFSAPPDNWTGTYDFTHSSRRAALQVHVGDSTDALNTALVGVRLSARPGCWLNLKAVGVNAVPMITNRVERKVSWTDLWTNADLSFQLGRNRVEKIITLKQPGHPTSFRFALRLAAGNTYRIINNSLHIYDITGTEWLRSIPTWGKDVNENPIRVSLIAAPDITIGDRIYSTIRIVPNATDLTTATYPVTVDPTIIINGTTALEDNSLYSGGATMNQGAYSNIQCITTVADISSSVEIFRIGSAFIPAGTINSALLYMFATTATGVVKVYAIKDANATWVEGTQTYGAEVGSSCWGKKIYNTVDWAGSAGCQTSGTDYDADASPPSVTVTAGWNAFSLKTIWLTDWRDAGRLNGGMILVNTGLSKTFNANSTEGGTKPYVDVDYTTGPSIPIVQASYRRRR